MSEVQKYLDCGCALLVGGERVWCPSCSGAAFDADPPPTVVDAKQSIADLERQLRATTDLLRVFYQSDEDTPDNPIMRKVGRQIARSEKLLTK